jgi:hypothetical protein
MQILQGHGRQSSPELISTLVQADLWLLPDERIPKYSSSTQWMSASQDLVPGGGVVSVTRPVLVRETHIAETIVFSLQPVSLSVLSGEGC